MRKLLSVWSHMCDLIASLRNQAVQTTLEYLITVQTCPHVNYVRPKSKGVNPFTCWAFKLILKYQKESFHSHFENSNWYQGIKRSHSIHILSIQIDTKISNRVIPFTVWAFKLIQDIKRSHSIHMLSIQIDTKIAKILKLVIHHYFKNIKLSFFASHIKRSFPLLVALRLLDTLE